MSTHIAIQAQECLPEDRAEFIAREYEDFVYIVSHDLAAPLRHIKEFTRLLVGAHGDLNDEEKQYVDFLECSLQKLDEMQRNLLVFSRLNTRGGSFKETDCNEVVAAVLRSLDEVLEIYDPVIQCQNLPVIFADPQQMALLFTALIDNAIKFHEKNTFERKVFIEAEEQDDFWQFCVRDNGIGVASEFHKEIFRFFRRLHPHVYGGAGAGLAVAQKIVYRHGGKIFIESVPGQGSSIFFTLKKL